MVKRILYVRFDFVLFNSYSLKRVVCILCLCLLRFALWEIFKLHQLTFFYFSNSFSTVGHRLHHRPAARDARPGETVEGPGGDFANVWRDRRRPLCVRARARFQPVFLLRGAGNFYGATHSGVFDVFEFADDGAPKVVEFGEAFRAGRAFDFR